jgi:hypothetical protein
LLPLKAYRLPCDKIETKDVHWHGCMR